MNTEKLLKDSMLQLGFEISEKQISQFMTYKQLLLEWNEKINLTAITDEKDIILKHFVDSVSLLTAIDIKEGMSFIDVGTGAGFPGIPVKIMFPQINITLLDSLQKRITFLEEVIGTLQLQNTECIHMRAEDGGQSKELREHFDCCVSRAVASLNILCEYCMPFVKCGGYFVSLKGPDVSQEIMEAQKAISTLGCKLEKTEKVEIPNSDITHSVIILKKLCQTPSQYPRKAGKASKSPIK